MIKHHIYLNKQFDETPCDFQNNDIINTRLNLESLKEKNL